MKVSLILGSVRANRQGIKALRFAENILKKKNWEITVIDACEWELPLLNKMYKSMDEPEEKFVNLHHTLNSSDGYFFVTAEYNHSIPAALKNLLDHYQKEYFFKPAAILSYSQTGFGGVRATEHLRLICIELGMSPISSFFAISKIQDTLDDNGESGDGKLEEKTDKFLNEFEWYLEAFKEQRKKGTPY
jgi:NAD(P)H-dependent FMN reductase